MEPGGIFTLSNRLPTIWFSVVGLALIASTQSVLATDIDFFEKKVRPILVEHCYECHSGDSVESGLRSTLSRRC